MSDATVQLPVSRLPDETPDAYVERLTRAIGSTAVHRLTLFKWRYSLECAGYSRKEAETLLFLAWMYRFRREQCLD